MTAKKKNILYYAHCIALYDTKQEKRDMELLSTLGFAVYNPNDKTEKAPVHKFKKLRAQDVDYDTAFDQCWGAVVKACTMLAFRALPDGSIPAGVAREIKAARDNNIPVIELPNAILKRSLTGEETREYLRDVGHR